jgi:hypothetical protein
MGTPFDNSYRYCKENNESACPIRMIVFLMHLYTGGVELYELQKNRTGKRVY